MKIRLEGTKSEIDRIFLRLKLALHGEEKEIKSISKFYTNHQMPQSDVGKSDVGRVYIEVN